MTTTTQHLLLVLEGLLLGMQPPSGKAAHHQASYVYLRIATHEFAAIKDEVLSKTRRRPILAVLFGTPESAEPPRG